MGKNTSPSLTVTKALLILLGISMGMLAMFPVGSVMAAPAATPTLEWSLDADLIIPKSEVAELGSLVATTDHIDALLTKLNAEGVKTEIRTKGSNNKGTIYTLTASGQGNVETFRKLIYTVATPQFNLLGGVNEMEIDSTVSESPDVLLVLEANPSTGYSWQVAEDSSMIEHASAEYEKHTLGYGVPERQYIHLASGRNGTGPIKLVYRRPWENAVPTRHFKLTLSSLPVTLDLSNPGAPKGSVSQPLGVVNDMAFPVVTEGDLPTHFDWRDQGIVTPVRDQGACGSCWAFATVGVMESSLGKSSIPNQDLSEQFLVSCNQSGWSCNGGGIAHMYHYDTLGSNQTTIGAVYETDKPYIASNGTCTSDYYKPYRLNGWGYVSGGSGIPTVDQIKNAIYTYGPVATFVCADNWSSYTGGIFSTNCTNIDHAVVLVGWDDPGQYWILRNSWGTFWGIGGYMYMQWGTSSVGTSTSWVTTPPSSTEPYLYGNFTGNGVWMYNGSAWSQVTPGNPTSMAASGSYLYGNFTGNGVWMYNGSAWSQVTPGNPTSMAASGSYLYGNFTGNGVWMYNGSAWSQVTPGNPTSMAASGSYLYGNFTGNGVWMYNGSAWSQVTPGNPTSMAASGSYLYGNFTGNGVWMYNGSAWSQVTPGNPTKHGSLRFLPLWKLHR